MRWHNGRSRRSRNLYSENASKGSETKKDEGAAHSIQARRSLLQQRPNTFAQTNSVFLISRLQNGGGPYIPCGRSHVRKPVNECIGDYALIDAIDYRYLRIAEGTRTTPRTVTKAPQSGPT